MRTRAIEITCVILCGDGFTGFQLGSRRIDSIKQCSHLLSNQLPLIRIFVQNRKSPCYVLQLLLKRHQPLLLIM